MCHSPLKIRWLSWWLLGLWSCTTPITTSITQTGPCADDELLVNGSCLKFCSGDYPCGGGLLCSTARVCVTPTPECTNGLLDAEESDVDCGGAQCAACPQGAECQQASDCSSLRCDGTACTASSCNDTRLNGVETDVDCGGSACSACATGKACVAGRDCLSGICTGKICQAASCNDAVQNAAESDVDCGGGQCAACSSGAQCSNDADCLSGFCGSDGRCRAFSCNNQLQDGSETDTDCGGTNCSACDAGKKCARGGDCSSAVCSAALCQAARCDDKVVNGSESSIDCGGPECTSCAVGLSCTSAADCASGYCSSNRSCQEAPPTDLAYTASTFVLQAGVAANIAPPTHVGGAVVAYSITPALPAGLVFSTTSGEISGTPAAMRTARLYRVSASNASGSTFVNVTLEIRPAIPVITVQPADVTVLGGRSTLFTVTATSEVALRYQWQREEVDIPEATASTYTTPVLGPTDVLASPIAYRVIVRDLYDNSVTSATARLTVNKPPLSITLQPTDQTAVIGATVSFSVAAAGSDGLTYQWLRNGQAIPDAIGSGPSSLYTTPALGLADRSSFFAVVVTDAYGQSLTSATALLIVNPPPPVITVQPQSQSIVGGQSATFAVTAQSAVAMNYQWYRDDGESAIAGATANVYATPAMGPADVLIGSYTYYVVVSDNYGGSAVSESATLTLSAPPLSIDVAPSSSTRVDGEAATFSVIASGVGSLSYQWFKNGVAADGATTSSYQLPAVTLADNGASITVRVSDTFMSSVMSRAATLQVNPQAPRNLTYAQNPAIYRATIAITNNTPSFQGGVPAAYTVAPPLPSGLDLNPNTGMISGTPASATAQASYTVTASNITGSTTAALAITVQVAPPANLTYTSGSQVYSTQVTIANNVPSSTGGAIASYAIAPLLPAGLQINSSTGIIVGTPSSVAPAAAYTVTATNISGSTTAVLTLSVIDHCTDGVRNATESDNDCGGADCTACASSKGCTSGSDCLSLKCTSGVCQKATCEATTTLITNGTLPQTTAGDAALTVSGTCNTGYTAGTGAITAKCQPNGSWTLGSGTCTLINCGTLPAAPANAVYNATTTTYTGVAITAACRTGYSGTITGSLLCTTNGTWENTLSGTCLGGAGASCTSDADCANSMTCFSGQCGIQGADCASIRSALRTVTDGVYTIDPDGAGGNSPFSAYCDMTTDGGGWTLVLRSLVNNSEFYYASAWWNDSLERNASAAPTSPSNLFTGSVNSRYAAYSSVKGSQFRIVFENEGALPFVVPTLQSASYYASNRSIYRFYGSSSAPHGAAGCNWKGKPDMGENSSTWYGQRATAVLGTYLESPGAGGVRFGILTDNVELSAITNGMDATVGIGGRSFSNTNVGSGYTQWEEITCGEGSYNGGTSGATKFVKALLFVRTPPSSCSSIKYNLPSLPSGVYTIDPDGVGANSPLKVYCDMVEGGGGWTLVAAQYEADPAGSWNEGTALDYMMGSPFFSAALLDTYSGVARGFALSLAQLPPHNQTAFGKGRQPAFIGYSNYVYTTGAIATTRLLNLKDGLNYDIHRDATASYAANDPESALQSSASSLSNTLTFDAATGGPAYSWAFSPAASGAARGYAMQGNLSSSSEAHAWTVWTRTFAAPTVMSYSPASVSFIIGGSTVSAIPAVAGTPTLFTISPALPAGLTMSASSGVISGAPTTASAAADYTVTASNSLGTATAVVNLAVINSPASCNAIKTAIPSATDGVYTIDPDGPNNGLAPFSAYCDMTIDGGGWTLVLNYLHKGGTNPPLNARTDTLPLLGANTLGTDESGGAYWGHAANSLLKEFSTASQLRFFGRTSAHTRIMHFKSTSTNCINYFKTNTDNCYDLRSTFTALTNPNHTTGLPNSIDSYWSGRGNWAMTDFPFYRWGAFHWGIAGGGSRWEVDDFPNNSANNTQHQIWIR